MSTSDQRYFHAHKRGEVQELREELHSAKLEKRREAVKKVIAAMTLGKDVSNLFPDVLNCMQTNSLDLKKLVYLYVVNYSQTQPELAILAVNTFRKDSVDPNPLVRALAIRTMACIRLDAVTEYLMEPLRRCCQDSDPYVRKTACMCIAKLHEIQPEAVSEHGFLEILHDLITDSNPAVVANCVAALTEMSVSQQASPDINNLQLTEQLIQNLLTALNECTEWGQVFILDALSSYNPPTARSAEVILERVVARLSHANHAVVLSAIRVVMKFMDRLTNTDLLRTLTKKLSPPLVTLLNSEPEIQYVVLKNIQLILQKRPNLVFVNTDVKIFFCKYSDPVYVKMEKLDVITYLVTDQNLEQVLLELREYANEVDVDFVRKAIRTIGKVGVRDSVSNNRDAGGSLAAEIAINVLLELIDTKVQYVVQQAIVVIKDIFRKYPNRYESIIATLCENLESLDLPEAKAAMIWVVGHYAERIDNADDLLDSFLDSFHDETSSEVRCALLTAIVKLFLKSPQNTQGMVTKCLKLCTESVEDPDLRDRGYIYWRLLSSDPKITKEVVLAPRPPISSSSNMLPPATLDKLVSVIGTLSSVYGQVPEAFLAKREKTSFAVEEDSDEDGAERLKQVQEELAVGGPTKQDSVEEKSSEDIEEEETSVSEVSDSEEDDDSDKHPSLTVQPNYQLSVAETVPGSQQKAMGLKLATCILRRGPNIVLFIAIQNMQPKPLGHFAIQMNRNCFGLSVGSANQLTDIESLRQGESRTAMVQILPNVNPVSDLPQCPFVVDIAFKCSLDLWYFRTLVELSAVLVPDASLPPEQFQKSWAVLAQKEAVSLIDNLPLVNDGAEISRKLQQGNLVVVNLQSTGSSHAVHLGGCTTNRIAIFAEIQIRNQGAKLAIRTDQPSLVPLMQRLIDRQLKLP